MSIRSFLFTCIILFHFLLSAQDEMIQANNQSFQSWNALQIQYSPIDKLSLDIETQLRLKSMGDTYNMSFIQLEAQYEPQPYIEVGVGYRNFDRLDDIGKQQGHEKFNRFYGYVQAKKSFERFDIRFRLQHQVRNQIDNSESPKNNSKWRYKLSSIYNIPNWALDPRLSIEFFMLDEFYSKEAYDKYRLYLGTKKRFSKSRALSFKYLFEKNIGINGSKPFHILSLRYEYRFVRN
jgi:hypothetical protein